MPCSPPWRSIHVIRITWRAPERPPAFSLFAGYYPGIERKPRCNRFSASLNAAPRSHSTTSMRNTAPCRPPFQEIDEPLQMLPTPPRPHRHSRRFRVLPLSRRICLYEGFEAPIHSNEPAVWQSKPKLRSLRRLSYHGPTSFPAPKCWSPLADSAPHRPRRTFRFFLADLMQPRDSVASRNSAVRHAEYDRLRACTCQLDLIHNLFTSIIHTVENQKGRDDHRPESPAAKPGLKGAHWRCD